ncbi:endonuclease/exonuclease/phosphatase family protein [Cognatishimia sp. WU-CL00825]|uniref:endonuclease/exonuclease/phosphatase family protein n=1 Tax=Cognatishimia sp. WU-CL00825 TaxID=3127658 RepID=UPI00310B2208
MGLPTHAERLRIATYHTELHRNGPGVMLRDITRGDAQVVSILNVIAAADPDIVVLQGIDHDTHEFGLSALKFRLADLGLDLMFQYAPPSNSGLQTGLDIDGDGRLLEPEDAQGYGEFLGQRGIAVLSRYPIDQRNIQNFNALTWQDFAAATSLDQGFLQATSAEIQETIRLSSTTHSVIPIAIGQQSLRLLTYHATPPVFDGPEDRNGVRNAHENLFFPFFLDGYFGSAPNNSFVIAALANIDPMRGEGHLSVIQSLLMNPRVQAPLGHRRVPTADWPNPPGRLRVSYLLPSSDIKVLDSGVFTQDQHPVQSDDIVNASRHRLVWVDIDF